MMTILANSTIFISPTQYLTFYSQLRPSILCLRRQNKRKQYPFLKSSRLILESAYLIASKLGVLPAPVELILRDQLGNGGGSGSGSGSGNGFGFGWGGGFFDGGRRKRGMKLGVLGVCALVFGMGLWVVVTKEMMVDANVVLGGLGLLLFGLSVDGWRKGAKDWVLGFCCCTFLMSLVLKRSEFARLVQHFQIPIHKKNASVLNIFSSGRTRKTKLF